MISDRNRDIRLWGKVSATTAEGCWEWTGPKSRSGYGTVTVGYKGVPVHRYFYEKIIGKIADGMVADHTCRNKCCVNPAHIEIVTPGENARRGKSPIMDAHRNNTCLNGHKWNRNNMRVRPQKDGTIKICCRICTNLSQKIRRKRKAYEHE